MWIRDRTCYLYDIPFLSFRIISVTPGGEDHSSQYADFWGTMAERSFLTTCLLYTSCYLRLWAELLPSGIGSVKGIINIK